MVGQHRVLVFCQLRGMLDIVEKDLLRYDVQVALVLINLPFSHPVSSIYIFLYINIYKYIWVFI